MSTMKNLPETDSPVLFADLKTFCLFLGYPRSGHSLVGALLDAHPDVIIAHELDVLKYVAAGWERAAIFHRLLENSRAAQAAGRRWGDYDYQVPGQWQGRFRRLRVIGDKKGGGSLKRLASDPGLLGRLRQTVALDIKFVHVVRNPYDNISTMARHRETPASPLDKCVESYFARCRTLAWVKRHIEDRDILDVRYESFVEDPAAHLEGLCRFLGVEAAPDYLSACTRIVFAAPHRSRSKVAWTGEQVERVGREMANFPFLAGYSYTS